MLSFEPVGLLRLLVVGPIVYVALVLTLRIAGKRTLAKMNAFDLVVTVALGSTLSGALISPRVTLLQGMGAIVLLVLLQFAVAWASIRVRWFQRLTRAEPTVLFHAGSFRHDIMAAERVTEAEVRQAMRASGYGRTEAVGAVVLESDGTFSVVGSDGADAIEYLLRERR